MNLYFCQKVPKKMHIYLYVYNFSIWHYTLVDDVFGPRTLQRKKIAIVNKIVVRFGQNSNFNKGIRILYYQNQTTITPRILCKLPRLIYHTFQKSPNFSYLVPAFNLLYTNKAPHLGGFLHVQGPCFLCASPKGKPAKFRGINTGAPVMSKIFVVERSTKPAGWIQTWKEL